MQEALDFKAESDAVAAILDGKSDADFNTVTLFKKLDDQGHYWPFAFMEYCRRLDAQQARRIHDVRHRQNGIVDARQNPH